MRYYSHEPFEATYYLGADLKDATERLSDPLDLNRYVGRTSGDALVVKEMPYQAGGHFPLLAQLATPPLLFLLRDPRLSIASRMKKKIEVGDSPLFPLIESGWELIELQIRYCRNEGIPLLIVDATEFRNHPAEIFPQVLEPFDLEFEAEMLRWRVCSEVDLDNLEGAHSHLYRRVLGSSGLLRAEAELPELGHFPARDGFRDHVVWCLELYRKLLEAPERVSLPARAGLAGPQG